MTFWNVYILVIIVIYLLAFFIRNLKTYFTLRTSIRGRSTKLTLSLVLSTIIYLITLAILFYPSVSFYFVKLEVFQVSILQYLGYTLMLLALLIGLAALFEMRNSWRIGIRHDQKTDLVTSGIYSISRNPYFLSYDLLFLGIFLIFPSLSLLILITGLIVTFHLMILEEEEYLEKMQGETYLKYKNKVGRYIFTI